MSRNKRKVEKFYRRPAPKTTGGLPIPQSSEKSEDCESVNSATLISWGDKPQPNAYNENPDIVANRKGLGVYDFMLMDDQIFSLALLKKVCRLASGFDIFSPDTSEDNKKITEFVRWSLMSNPNFSPRSLLFSMLTAMDYGYSLAEKVYQYNEDGPYKGLVSYKTIAPKSPHGFRFDRKHTGELKPDGIIQVPDNFTNFAWDDQTKNMISGQYPRYKTRDFVVFSYNERFRNPYGLSDFKAAFRGWIAKDAITKFWHMYLERFSAPIPTASVPPGTDNDTITKLRGSLESLQNRSCLTHPEDIKIKYLESERNASPGFEKAVAIHNGEMSRSMLVPELMGFFGGAGSGGSYGLGKTQYDVFIMLLDYIGFAIEEDVFNKQIIRPLVDLNFKDVKAYPEFKFNTIKRETRKDRAQLLKLLHEMGLLKKIQPWMFAFCDLPIQQAMMAEHGEDLASLVKSSGGDEDEIDGRRDESRTETDERSIVDDNSPMQTSNGMQGFGDDE